MSSDIAAIDPLPSFGTCPTTAQTVQADAQWHLVGQVKANMTITKPTLIAADRTGCDFAVTFDDGGVDLQPFKKGSTIVIAAARRTPPSSDRDNGQGFVRIAEDSVSSVFAIAGRADAVVRLWEQRRDMAVACGGCGIGPESAGDNGGELKRCLGCASVQYCSKECQATAWSKSHKKDCKILKNIADILFI